MWANRNALDTSFRGNSPPDRAGSQIKRAAATIDFFIVLSDFNATL
jgi:hypothetical protein